MSSGAMSQSMTLQTMPDGTKLKVGLNRYRYWSGANQASNKPTYTNVYVTNKKGEILRTRRRYTKPPTRSLRYDEHNYTFLLREEFDAPYTWRWKADPPNKIRYGINASGTSFSPSLPPNFELSLLGKLREKVAGSDFNAGIFLGESKQALGMIAENATRILTAARAFRRGDVLGGAKALGARPRKGARNVKTPTYAQAGNLWLEYSYGWSPLVNDVYDGAIFVAHNFSTPLKQKYRARYQEVGKIWPASSEYRAGTALLMFRGQIIATLTERDVVQLSGLTDPLSVAWELVPWSFVADWFIPIGSYLSARGLAQSLTGQFTKTLSRKSELGDLYNVNPNTLVFSRIMYSWNELYVERSTSSSLSVPTPSIKSLDSAPSWKRALNAVSLLAQRFPRS